LIADTPADDPAGMDSSTASFIAELMRLKPKEWGGLGLRVAELVAVANRGSGLLEACDSLLDYARDERFQCNKVNL
jgi:hypothetical protein